MPHFDADWDVMLMQLRNRLQEIHSLIFSPRREIQELYRTVTGLGKGPEGIPKTGWSPFKVMERWGGYDQTTWFRMQAVVPAEFSGKTVAALLNPCAYSDVAGTGSREESGEGLAYVNGAPRQGIDRNHGFVILTSKARKDETFDIALECTPGTWHDMSHVFAQAQIAVMNREVWDLYWDGQVYMDVVRHLPVDSTVRRRLFEDLFAAMLTVDLRHPGSKAFLDSVSHARGRIKDSIKAFPAEKHAGALTLLGHSHIDTAWLWPLRETRRKVGRTFATMLKLMEEYPEFHFSASQPELYMFAKENHPALWKGIKRRVREGRWEPCGATWVEQDSNVSGGEALVRQFLYGNRFYEQEFGKRSTVAWLPDAFGFPWTLPQILVQAGMETFHTIKISWSKYTKFPYGYFWWQGIDGSRIRAIMTPLNYNGDPTPKDCTRQWEEFQQKHLVKELPMSFGFGDGGGGPTPKMIEYGKRLANIAGVPRCSFGRTEDCFARMHRQTPAQALPTHNGELYLELHRGCQTTQARTKRNNRKCEWLLHDVELLSAFAALHGLPYNHDAINRAWRILLTHQFHDILPGSSIREVYTDADNNYAAIRDLLGPVQEKARAFLAGKINSQGEGVPFLVWNGLSWKRGGLVTVNVPVPKGAFHVLAADGAVLPSQRVSDTELLVQIHEVPPLGYTVCRLVPGAAAVPLGDEVKATATTLENGCVKVALDACGQFKRVYDKQAGRDVLAKGHPGNVVELFEDRPASNDAWDIDYNFESVRWPIGKPESMELIENGPLRSVIRVVRRTENSLFRQDITLYAGSPRIEVKTFVDWHEKRCLLKVAFPVEILSPRASYHIQFGVTERATHKNTAFDHARFEVPAHHWADLSEGDYGVSLLNDCKYGYDVRDNVLRLSLLRSPVDPDPTADEGEHLFTYALLPHRGDWRAASLREGYELNAPLHAWPVPAEDGPLPETSAFIETDRPNVIIETVKQAEDSDELVVRLYEAHGTRGVVNLKFHVPLAAVRTCNLMEDPGKPLKINKDNTLTLSFTPWQIVSLLVKMI